METTDSRVEHETAKELEYLRQALIDIGKSHNALTNFRPRALSVDAFGVPADEVFTRLVNENKQVRFSPSKTNLASDTLGSLNDELDFDASAFGHKSSNVLQTQMPEHDLAVKLRRISYESRSQTQELGYSSLYLALGFLTYYENNAAEHATLAPLLLVPVELTVNKKGAYSMRYSGAEIGPNIALRESLKGQFGVDLPELGDGDTPSQIFNDVADAVKAQSGWSVNVEKIHLGFFSFASFLMYNDLDPESWPEEKQPSKHPVLQRLLSKIAGIQPAHLDWGGNDSDVSWPDELIPLILDADSSQVRAINRVSNGSDFVIDGPPGTGKSQTIANLIAHAVSRGKQVLFVADKLVALEVVKNRLDDAGLGQLVLELHSHKGNKLQVINQLKDTVELPHVEEPEWNQVNQEYVRLAGKLDAYSDSVNEDILGSKMSFVRVAGELSKSDKQATGRQAGGGGLPGLERLSVAQLERGFELLRALSTQRDLIGVPDESLYKMFHHVDLQPYNISDAANKFARARDRVAEVDRDVRRIASKLGVQRPTTFESIERFEGIASRAIDAPPNIGLPIGDEDWEDLYELVMETVQAGSQLRQIGIRRNAQIPAEAWAADLNNAHAVWESKGRNWFRLLSKDYRQARSRLTEVLGTIIVDDYQECLEVLKDINANRLLTDRLEVLMPLINHLFRDDLCTGITNWDQVSHVCQWVHEARADVENGTLPRVASKWMKSGEELTFSTGDLSDVKRRVRDIRAYIDDGSTSLHVDVMAKLALPVNRVDLTELFAYLNRLGSMDYQELAQFREFVRLEREFSVGPLSNAMRLVESRDYSFETVKPIIRRMWHLRLFDHARFNFRPITNFHLKSHEDDRELFVKRDIALHQTTRQHVSAVHRDSMPELVPAGQPGVLLHEFNKKTKHLPTRGLMESAGLAIQKIKPIFMMSPMSVAKFLKPGSVEFDLLIFDEASQVRTSDAIGSILRSKQVVVVGDDKQLPPTSFFLKMASMDGIDTEADDGQVVAMATGIESILDLFRARNTASERLKWHYRSRNEGLITFSNSEFYQSELVTFPSSGTDPDATGIRFVHSPDHRYVTGKAVNTGEARELAHRIMQHAKTSPHLSLGVVAFSVSQRDRILDELETLRRARPDLDGFFQHGGLEPFFVKNLENVQGDERDVILISVGYGRTDDGKMSMNFGPVNRQGGERRLNVLVTRAKKSLEVFCNFTSDDIKVTAGTPGGVVALSRFLAYAENPNVSLPVFNERGTESIFEEQVAEVVRQLGYEVETQLGQSEYRIDIAVRDKNRPGRFILAIECDGAMYHSSISARDRDRLRQQVLESHGWRIHRIWSTDWFRRTEPERLDYLAEAIHSAEIALVDQAAAAVESKASCLTDPDPSHGSQRSAEREALGDADLGRDECDAFADQDGPSQWAFKHRPYERAEVHLNHDLYSTSWGATNSVIDALSTVIDTEAPVHINIVARRLTDALKMKRTKKAVQRVRGLIESVGITLFSDFVYPSGDFDPYPRDRSNFDQQDKRLEYVPNDEIEEAILIVVRGAIEVERDEAIQHALNLLGFKRSTFSLATRMEKAIQSLISRGRIASEDGILSIPDPDA